MTIENLGKMIKVTADEGKRLALKDRSAVYDTYLYAPLSVDTDNYIEVTDEEAEALKEELEAKAMEGMK